MKATIFLVLKRLAYLALAYFFLRCFYLAYNWSSFQNESIWQLISVFFLGLRFDISTIIKVNAVFFLFWLFPVRVFHEGWFAKILFTLFAGVNIAFFWLNAIDAELVHFSGQRLTVNYFEMANDIRNQFGQLLLYYWVPALFIAIFCMLFWRFIPRDSWNIIQLAVFRKVDLIFTFVFLVFLVVGVRGGLQNKPLRPPHAFSYGRDELGHLALNSTFTFLNSIGKASQTKIHFLTDIEVDAILKRDRTAHFKNFWSKPQNVVIIMVESLALEFVSAANKGVGYTPFLDSLAARGLFFTNFFANGRRSIEAVPSILASVPSLLNTAFLTSNYQGTKLLGLGQILKANNYETAFMHGAANGTMFFDSFTARVGFEHYVGLNEYPSREKNYDGFWGIFDEPFLQHAGRTLGTYGKPFGAVIFTLSSHQPYTIPSQHKDRFAKGTLEIHETVGYSDYAIGEFFKSIEKEDWYRDTLFVITGDHTQKSDQLKYQNTQGLYRVPLILFHPQIAADKWPATPTDRFAQHADIVPTVLDVLNIDSVQLSKIGTSLFSTPDDAFVVNRTDEGYWYASATQNFLQLDFNGAVHPALSPDNKDVMRFKAYLQYVINSLVENKLQPAQSKL